MPTDIITGARAGIGLEYMRQLATSLNNIIIAINRDLNADMTDLDNILGSSNTKAQLHVLKGELTSPKSLQSRLPQGLKIDMLIQNAAILLPTTRNEKASSVTINSFST